MAQTDKIRFSDDPGRSELVQLGTLVRLRWMAVAGQSVAVAAGIFALDLDLALGPVLATISALIAANLIFQAFHPRPTARRGPLVALFLIFDIMQLGVMLGLTGGLNNPFAVLILAPATIGASVLPRRWAALSGLVALAAVGLIGLAYLPLMTRSGATLTMPALLRLGVWVALTFGIVFLGFYARRVWIEIQMMSNALMASREALAREQKLAEIGGVVAATAHELGTPLATIKLASSELRAALNDAPDLREDADLIHAQADRCREILRQMGRQGQSDHLGPLPLQALVEDAAAPHMDRAEISILIAPESEPPDAREQPEIGRRPELLHGLRNLIQNAVDHAESKVEITLFWSPTQIAVSVRDDGPGFPPHLIGRLGNPLLQRFRSPSRPNYEGMGLGLFIAKTLLRRCDAVLVFSNHTTGGAIATVKWPRKQQKT